MVDDLLALAAGVFDLVAQSGLSKGAQAAATRCARAASISWGSSVSADRVMPRHARRRRMLRRRSIRVQRENEPALPSSTDGASRPTAVLQCVLRALSSNCLARRTNRLPRLVPYRRRGCQSRCLEQIYSAERRHLLRAAGFRSSATSPRPRRRSGQSGFWRYRALLLTFFSRIRVQAAHAATLHLLVVAFDRTSRMNSIHSSGLTSVPVAIMSRSPRCAGCSRCGNWTDASAVRDLPRRGR